MPTRPMLNLENGKCYEITFLHDWCGKRKVKIIQRKEVHSERLHSYGSTSLHGFSYIWDYGYEKGPILGDGQYSAVAARELEGTELEEFEAQLEKRKKT